MDVQTLWFRDVAKNKTLGAGAYQATLIAIKPVDDTEKWRRTDLKAQKRLEFIFEIGSGTKFAKTIVAIRDDAWPCMALIRSMAGAHQPAAALIDDAEQLQNFLSGWVGQMFLLQIERCKIWTHDVVVSASPIPNDGGQE